MTLDSSPVISALAERDREIAFDRMVHRRLEAGEPLYFAGEEKSWVHVVSDGLLKLSARSPEGEEAILFLAVPGDLVGEVAALDRLPHPLDAVAVTPTVVLGLDAELMNELLNRNPRATLELSRQLGRRLRWICDATLERTAGEVPARLAGRLLDLAELLGRMRGGAIEMELPLGQHDLGSLAGMCRESACKTLRRFKAEGLLDYRGKQLRILQPEGLERIRCSGRFEKRA